MILAWISLISLSTNTNQIKAQSERIPCIKEVNWVDPCLLKMNQFEIENKLTKEHHTMAILVYRNTLVLKTNWWLDYFHCWYLVLPLPTYPFSYFKGVSLFWSGDFSSHRQHISLFLLLFVLEFLVLVTLTLFDNAKPISYWYWKSIALMNH